MADVDAHDGSDDEVAGAKTKRNKGSSKSRRELPEGAVAILKEWLLSPEHFTHPYPTPQDQVILMQKTGIDKKQLKNWFTNARRRIWKPMLKKQLEQGKLAQTGGGGVVAIGPTGPGGPGGGSGGVPGVIGPPPGTLTPPTDAYGNAPVAPAPDVMHSHYGQQQPQPQQPQQQYDAYGNPTYPQQQPQQQPGGAHPGAPTSQQQGGGQYGQQWQSYQQQQGQGQPNMAQSNSIGSLPPLTSGSGGGPGGGGGGCHGVSGTISPNLQQQQQSSSPMNKTDSHAVLMELFARDQDLVRQATEGARMKAQAAVSGGDGSGGGAGGGGGGGSSFGRQQSFGSSGNVVPSQHPMMAAAQGGGGASSGKMGSVPSFNSWPHFSSVSSLNNLGTMTGVKSITNMSGADLVSQGSLNKKGNLAQVKSIESMGRADSYAFLEVFFDDRGGGSGGGAGGSASVGGGSAGASGLGGLAAVASSSSQQLQQQQRGGAGAGGGVKREQREEDNDIGLNLDGDESPSTSAKSTGGGDNAPPPPNVVTSGAPTPAPLPPDGRDVDSTTSSADSHKNNLKRAYDDALAARGLIAVRRSCENLTDLALPAKMQRTLSQEYLKQMVHGHPGGGGLVPNNPLSNPSGSNPSPPTAQSFVGGYDYSNPNATIAPAPTTTPMGGDQEQQQQQKQQTASSDAGAPQSGGEQSAGHPSQEGSGSGPSGGGPSPDDKGGSGGGGGTTAPLSDPSSQNSSVEVPATTKCSLCGCINVDTQLRPCGHMFHGRCLKPSLQGAVGPPQCPIDRVVMQSAVLAVPTDENAAAAAAAAATCQ